MLSIGAAFEGVVNNFTVAPTELVLATTPLVSVPKDTVAGVVMAAVTCLTGAGTTQLRINLRRGPLVTSPNIGAPWIQDVGAALNTIMSIMGIDTMLNLAQVQYSITGLASGSSATSTGVRAAIAVFFLS